MHWSNVVLALTHWCHLWNKLQWNFNILTPLRCSCNLIFSIRNTLGQRQNCGHFADDIFKCIFLNKYAWILLKISLKFVPKGLIDNIPSLVWIMAWRRRGVKPLSEAMMVGLLTHLCDTQLQWIKLLSMIRILSMISILSISYDTALR